MILDLRFWILDWGRTRMKAISSARVSDSHSDNRKSKIQNRKRLGLSVIAFALVVVGPVAQAQQAGKIFRIGFLDISSSNSVNRLEAFRQELSKLGWIEGKNITIEYRFAEQKPERLPELAAELVRQKVDLIVVSGGPAALAAKGAILRSPS
jgi:putative ABC transport system substrate-binding protein